MRAKRRCHHIGVLLLNASLAQLRWGTHSYRKWVQDDKAYLVQSSVTTHPSAKSFIAPGEAWEDIDTSFVDMHDLAEIPTVIDKPPSTQQSATATTTTTGETPSTAEAAQIFIGLCKDYFLLDREEYHFHTGCEAQKFLTNGPMEQSHFDMFVTARRKWFTVRSIFIKWRSHFFTQISGTRRSAASKSDSTSRVLPVEEMFSILSWFTACENRALVEIYQREWDSRPKSDYDPLDLSFEVRCVVAHLRRMKDPLVFFQNAQSGSERLTTLETLCKKYNVSLQLYRGDNAKSRKQRTRKGHQKSELSSPLDSAETIPSTPSQALTFTRLVSASQLGFSDQRGAISNELRFRGIAVVLKNAFSGALENFDGDDMCQLLRFLLDVRNANPEFNAEPQSNNKQKQPKKKAAATALPTLPLALYMGLAVQRCRALLYNKTADRNVYSDSEFFPLLNFLETNPMSCKYVVPDSSPHFRFMEGMRQAVLGPRVTSKMLELMEEYDAQLNTRVDASPSSVKNSEIGTMTLSTFKNDLYSHINFKAMTDNTRVMRLADALRMLKSTAERCNSNTTTTIPSQAKETQVLRLVDINLSVNCAHIDHPKIVAEFLNGFAMCNCIPSSIDKLEVAALRLLHHPHLQISDVALMLHALQVFRRTSTVLPDHVSPKIIALWGPERRPPSPLPPSFFASSMTILEAFSAIHNAESCATLLSAFYKQFVGVRGDAAGGGPRRGRRGERCPKQFLPSVLRLLVTSIDAATVGNESAQLRPLATELLLQLLRSVEDSHSSRKLAMGFADSAAIIISAAILDLDDETVGRCRKNLQQIADQSAASYHHASSSCGDEKGKFSAPMLNVSTLAQFLRSIAALKISPRRESSVVAEWCRTIAQGLEAKAAAAQSLLTEELDWSELTRPEGRASPRPFDLAEAKDTAELALDAAVQLRGCCRTEVPQSMCEAAVRCLVLVVLLGERQSKAADEKTNSATAGDTSSSFELAHLASQQVRRNFADICAAVKRSIESCGMTNYAESVFAALEPLTSIKRSSPPSSSSQEAKPFVARR